MARNSPAQLRAGRASIADDIVQAFPQDIEWPAKVKLQTEQCPYTDATDLSVHIWAAMGVTVMHAQFSGKGKSL
ncbi:hypothetical protein GCM10011499_16040 [Pelagibacterium lentulum]|uniref:Uncharacterized protein n=1 Tax=Pelagibacterium lentulum TaxID=2029865 RepID=A0A916RA08_9HYPH|nr:hypothetical protein GCM10011499_16040 [Pelagibacterium lentulum]